MGKRRRRGGEKIHVSSASRGIFYSPTNSREYKGEKLPKPKKRILLFYWGRETNKKDRRKRGEDFLHTREEGGPFLLCREGK